MTPLDTDIRVNLALERGDVREGLGLLFVKRLEKLVDELLSKLDCPETFWVIYTVKWDYVSRKIREMWQVTDKAVEPMLGQVVYEVHKSGKAEFKALPLDIPVPDSAYDGSDDYVWDNYEDTKNIILSNQYFQSI